MPKPLLRLVTIIAICSCSLMYGATLTNINSATVPVEGRTQSNLKAGIRQALQTVLVKITGNAQIDSVPTVQNLLQDTTGFVQSYHYVTKQTGNNPSLYLHVSFNHDAIDQQLTKADQAIWSDQRPLTLIWLNDNSNNPQEIVASSDNSKLEQSIEATASERGIPIVMPIMDLQDQARLSTPDHTLNNKAAQALLSRYHADAILIGSLTTAGGQWQAQWHFSYHNQPTSWMNSNSTAAAVADAGINQLADMYANQFSVYKNKNLENSYTIKVDNVNDLSQYTRVIHALQQDPAIDTVSVGDMQDSSILLTITTATNLENLSYILTQNNSLSVSSTSHSSKVDLTLHWRQTSASTPQTHIAPAPDNNPNQQA